MYPVWSNSTVRLPCFYPRMRSRAALQSPPGRAICQQHSHFWSTSSSQSLICFSLDQVVHTCRGGRKVFMKVLRHDNLDPGEYAVGEGNHKSCYYAAIVLFGPRGAVQYNTPVQWHWRGRPWYGAVRHRPCAWRQGGFHAALLLPRRAKTVRARCANYVSCERAFHGCCAGSQTCGGLLLLVMSEACKLSRCQGSSLRFSEASMHDAPPPRGVHDHPP